MARGDEDLEAWLSSWIAAQLGDARDVAVEGLNRFQAGYSAEMLMLSVSWRAAVEEHRQDVVVRVRPPEPGLLPPYDLKRQFDILQALDATSVQAPRALWYGSDQRLGGEFYVMERSPGQAYEQGFAGELPTDPAQVARMCESMIQQLAAIHTVDLDATGLVSIADGRGYLEREIDHWAGEIRRVQRGRLPGLERLLAVLRERRPEQCPTVTLVHGDAKPGNFAFVGDEVSAVFDWEMATLGDPLADIGYAELQWTFPGSITALPGAPTVDDFVARWEYLTGIATRDRHWYRGFQAFKVAVILLVAGQLFEDDHSDDLRFASMVHAVPMMTRIALGHLGINEELEPGPILPSPERLAAAQAKAASR